MRTKIRFALAALTAAVLGLQPAFAQQPEAELKKAQEQLEKLLKELKDKETKKAEAPKPPVPPTPPTPPKPTVAWAQLHNTGGDATAVLKGLASSKDPKIAALAKELLEHLHKAAPKEGNAFELHLELAKPAADGNGGTFEFKAVPAKPGTEFKVVPFPGAPATAAPGEKVERRVVVVEGKPLEGKVVEGGRIVVAGEKLGDPVRTVTVTAAAPAAPAAGVSSLKLSADGKTAALLSADGTISIFDVVTGKEMMKFAGKK
jgi:hypothetical protein